MHSAEPTPPSLEQLLDALEVIPGDLVYLHTSFKHLSYLDLTPREFVERFLAYVGPGSTVALPSFAWNIDRTQRPWAGYAEYFRTRPPFDVRRTPANIGIVPEIFRTRPLVRRSADFWWSVAASGPLAEELTADQAGVPHPFGPESTFVRLANRGAKVVGLGVSLNTTSLAPIVDHDLGERHPQIVFSPSLEAGTVIDENGRETVTRAHWLLPEVVRLIQPSEVIARSHELHGRLHRVDVGASIHFSYRFSDYAAEAMSLARDAMARGHAMPWLERYPLKDAR